jgi:hypothetical protein
MHLGLVEFSCHSKSKRQYNTTNYCRKIQKMCLIIIYHSPTNIQRIPMQKMGSAPQNSIHSWSAATLLICRGPVSAQGPGPHVFVNFRHYQLFYCDQHNLLSYAMIVLHLLPFYSRNKLWIVWQRLCHKRKWNWISLLVAFVIIACMDCFPFLDFLFSVLLLNFSPLVLHCRRPCC